MGTASRAFCFSIRDVRANLIKAQNGGIAKSRESTEANLRDAIRDYFQYSQDLLQSLNGMAGKYVNCISQTLIHSAPDRETITLSEQLQICQDLYGLFELCGPIWSSSEGLMEIYVQGAIKQGAAASFKALSAAVAGQHAYTAFQAASQHRSAGISIMENVPTESTFQQWGRALGMRNSPTPKQVAQASANAHKLIAEKTSSWAIIKAVIAIFTAIIALISGILAVLSYRKSRIFREGKS